MYLPNSWVGTGVGAGFIEQTLVPLPDAVAGHLSGRSSRALGELGELGNGE